MSQLGSVACRPVVGAVAIPGPYVRPGVLLTWVGLTEPVEVGGRRRAEKPARGRHKPFAGSRADGGHRPVSVNEDVRGHAMQTEPVG